MLKGHMELPSETRGIAVGEEIVLLTEEEFKALEARKQRITELEKRLENVYVDASGALCVAPPRQEAAPDAPDEERLTEAEWARRWLNVHGHLSTTHGGPPCPRWCGKLSLLTDDGHFVRATEALDGYASEEALLVALKDIVERKHFATPDFAAMDPADLSLEEVQALRDWLDERGRRRVRELVNEVGTRWSCDLWARDTYGHTIADAEGPTEPAALLALCQKVAAEEAS